MPRLNLTAGAYSAASFIANAQRSVNLFPEENPENTNPPVPVTHYPRPGLTFKSSAIARGHGRCLYTSTQGKLYAVVDQNVYYIDPNWKWTLVGTLLTPALTPVILSDNGTTAVIVDGSANGYTINLSTNAFAQIGDPNFYGATRTDFIDTFLVFNRPNTNQWYSTLSSSVTFNALFIGVKTAWPDNIQTLVTVERAVWILGKYKSELWFNAGSTPFPFQLQPGLIIEHGCASPYSVAKQDVNCFWLSQSPEGARMAMQGTQNLAQRISTHAIEQEFLKYPRVDDAIGSVFQISGHAFYCLDFPTADKTWVYDLATKLWHEWTSIDTNGIEHRCLTPFKAYAYGTNLGLDWQTGNLYQLDMENFSDNGQAIEYIRSFPHVVAGESERVTVWKFVADMECGSSVVSSAPLVSLRLSRDRGASWGNKVTQPLGAQGLYFTRPTWNRLGYMVDGVFELSWASPVKTALNGAFIVVEPHEADI